MGQVTEQSNSFAWDELLFHIADKRVIPVIGKDVLVLSLSGKEVYLEHYLANLLGD